MFFDRSLLFADLVHLRARRTNPEACNDERGAGCIFFSFLCADATESEDSSPEFVCCSSVLFCVVTETAFLATFDPYLVCFGGTAFS